jgi:hypothetical protein
LSLPGGRPGRPGHSPIQRRTALRSWWTKPAMSASSRFAGADGLA